MPLNIKQLTLAVGQKFRENAIDAAPTGETGNLKKGFFVSYRGNGVVSIDNNEPYAAAVNNGTRERIIKPNVSINPPRGERKLRKKKKGVWYNVTRKEYAGKAALQFKIGGNIVYAKEVRMPSTPPNDFMERAMDKTERDGYGYLLPMMTKDLKEDVAQDLISKIKLEIVI